MPAEWAGQRVPRKGGSGGGPWTVLGAVLAVLFALLMLFAVLGWWTHGTLVQEKGFVGALGPLAGEEELQSWVADTLSRQIQDDTLLAEELEKALPTGLGFLSGSLRAEMRRLVSQAARRLVQSDFFQQVWEEALRQLHPSVAGFVLRNEALSTTSDGTVYLDLGPLGVEMLALVGDMGLSLPESLQPAAETGLVQLFQYRPMPSMQRWLEVVDRTRWALLVAGVVCLLAALVFARRRSRVFLVAGGTLVVGFVALEAGLWVERSTLLGRLGGDELPAEVGKAFWSALTGDLATAGIVGACVGVALLVGGLVVGRLSGRPRVAGPAGVAAARR